jgi:hypothetical protein
MLSNKAIFPAFGGSFWFRALVSASRLLLLPATLLLLLLILNDQIPSTKWIITHGTCSVRARIFQLRCLCRKWKQQSFPCCSADHESFSVRSLMFWTARAWRTFSIFDVDWISGWCSDNPDKLFEKEDPLVQLRDYEYNNCSRRFRNVVMTLWVWKDLRNFTQQWRWERTIQTVIES